MFYLIWPPFCFPSQLWSLAPEIFFSSPTRLHPPKLLSCALWNVQLIFRHCLVCFTLLPWHIPGCFPARLFPLKSPRVRLFYSSFPKQETQNLQWKVLFFASFKPFSSNFPQKKKTCKFSKFMTSNHLLSFLVVLDVPDDLILNQHWPKRPERVMHDSVKDNLTQTSQILLLKNRIRNWDKEFCALISLNFNS